MANDDLLARPGQTLDEHLQNVAAWAARFGEKVKLPKLLHAAGLLHDYGKSRPEFQAYLTGGTARRGEVEHSIYGAVKGYDAASAYPPAAEVLANIIAAHHGRLYDYLSPDGETKHYDRVTGLHEDAAETSAHDNAAVIDVKALAEEFKQIIGAMHVNERAFGLSMLTRLAYSCLVDADRLDAFLFESQTQYESIKPGLVVRFADCSTMRPDWAAMLANLHRRLEAFKDDSEMAKLRQTVSGGCGSAGRRDKGIYTLEVPTGGGKTLASLRFALEHAKRHNMERIIYVIPYLSILSQTAKVLREALNAGEETVLEHHSGFLPKDEENEARYYKLHTDRWDSPVILTTQVQFLESVFSAKGSDLRKLHNMANAVFIFDEAQSIPIKCTYLFNGAINFLQNVCGSTVLICSATQPPFGKAARPLRFAENAALVDYGQAPQRTGIENALVAGGYGYAELASFVMEKHAMSTLVIVNTKAAAKNLYEELKKRITPECMGEPFQNQTEFDFETTGPVLHLSTNMCSAHRDAVIEEVRGRLDARQPVICVSTQLIEAGVDISFECVIRDVAGLDSIYQAAGRCNRHGEYGGVKPVYVINIRGENLDKLPDIKIGAEITRQLFDESTPDIDEYYRKYFFKQQNLMNYPVKNGDLYDWLTVNDYGKGAYRNSADKQGKKSPVMWSAIRSAADEFFIIDKGRTEVVVPYGEGMDLLDQYARTDDIVQKRKLLQRLGKYGVSLFKYQVDALEKAGALFRQGDIIGLEKGFYDGERGVDLNGQHEFLNV